MMDELTQGGNEESHLIVRLTALFFFILYLCSAGPGCAAVALHETTRRNAWERFFENTTPLPEDWKEDGWFPENWPAPEESESLPESPEPEEEEEEYSEHETEVEERRSNSDEYEREVADGNRERDHEIFPPEDEIETNHPELRREQRNWEFEDESMHRETEERLNEEPR